MGTFLHPNYKQLRHATPIQIIDCHSLCRPSLTTGSTKTTTANTITTSEPSTKKQKLFLESLMDEISPSIVPQTNKDEVDLYIEFQLKDNETYSNPLVFWRQHEQAFPHLSKLAKKIFSIPCSSAAVEREFSAAGQIVTQRRSSLEPGTINDIIFLRSVENDKKNM